MPCDDFTYKVRYEVVSKAGTRYLKYKDIFDFAYTYLHKENTVESRCVNLISVLRLVLKFLRDVYH